MHMHVSGHKTYVGTANCPNLLEWTGWGSSFCRLRYMVPDVLTPSEILEYCKNNHYSTCVFFMKQLDMISQNHMIQGE